MIPAVNFGKLLLSAIACYKAQNYTESNNLLAKALLINKSDFTANFWKMRIVVMQEKCEEAINLITVCRKLKPAARVKDLLEPWEKYCLGKINETNDNTIDILALNNDTDNLLEYYQHHRSFRFLDIVYAVLLYFGEAPLLIPFNLSVDMTAIISGLIYTPIILVYYYNKATLVPNIYVVVHYGINKIRQILKSNSFRLSCLFILLLTTIIFKRRLDFTHINTTIFIVSAFFYPIFEELFYRGFLYGYLKKYGKELSYIIVTVVFYAAHMELSNSWHIVLSLICLLVYDQEKTILAPILIHIINNILAAVFVR
ncbi:caax protease self-immunity [Lucifera butyrica]|uniref:Caax protease self-immunity n=1 Tax=Lucifera butyrica TaxID=1351585 RepID=A0A498RCZ8_9FIRM|nr:CPBP family intramembrane glutamic endopeptidase [Lucifera butyrica]VBB09169.1 caax protease self-immunity [Lucifera butyrica]